MASRPGLNLEKIVLAAADLMQREGESALSLSALAKHFGVKPPSLYNHVSSLAELHRALRLHSLHALQQTLQQAVLGRAGSEALHAASHAYRAYALQHPALYRMTLRSTEADDAELQQLGHDLLYILLAIFRPYDFTEQQALHATRSLRSALHGFVSLEIEGGFALALDTDESFQRMLHLLDEGFSAGRI